VQTGRREKRRPISALLQPYGGCTQVLQRASKMNGSSSRPTSARSLVGSAMPCTDTACTVWTTPSSYTRLTAGGVEAAQHRQRRVDRGWLVVLGELGAIGAHVAGGRLEQLGLVLRLEPGGEALEVGDVLPRRSLADRRVLGEEDDKRVQRVIGRINGGLDGCDRAASRRRAGGQGACVRLISHFTYSGVPKPVYLRCEYVRDVAPEFRPVANDARQRRQRDVADADDIAENAAVNGSRTTLKGEWSFVVYVADTASRRSR